MAYIDKENLLKDLITIYAPMQEQKDILVKCIKKVNEQPTADVEEVKHGEWDYIATHDCFSCDICKFDSDVPMKYCGGCGAKMNGKDINVLTKDGGKEE